MRSLGFVQEAAHVQGHGTYLNESCHTYGCGSCHTYGCGMAHVWMQHGTRVDAAWHTCG